jgi:hypothetical protein
VDEVESKGPDLTSQLEGQYPTDNIAGCSEIDPDSLAQPNAALTAFPIFPQEFW